VNTRLILAVGGMAALAGAALPASAQEVVEHNGTLAIRPVVRPANRASRIVGLPVRNYQNQELGRVEDVVFDLNTGRIAYVVVAVPSDTGDRWVAVPPGALTAAADGSNQLVMNMDRLRLQSAPTFARDNWPDVDRPFTGAEAFWGPALNVAEREGVDLNRPPVTVYTPPPNDYRTYQGVAPRYESSTTTERTRPYVTRSSFRGQVTAVNPETRTMSVESKAGEIRDFVFSDRPNLQLKNNRNPRIVDIKVGFPVIVGYREDPDGTLTAQTVIRTDTPEVK
jgi:sporulation protein YlmC with PRC-barrel domain